jgi:hypothetical protein
MCKVNIAAHGRRILPQVWLGEEDTVLGTAFSSTKEAGSPDRNDRLMCVWA